MNNIARRLKEIRLKNHLTQEKFGKLFHISPKTVSNYENNQRTPDIDFLLKICDKFNITLDYFMLNSANENEIAE